MTDRKTAIRRITDSELLGLPFGSRIKVVWHNSTHHHKNDEYYGVIFGDKIGYDDGEFDDTRTIAECVFNDWCMVYILDEKNLSNINLSVTIRDDNVAHEMYCKGVDDFANWLVEQGILGNRCISEGEITDYGKVYAKKYKEQLKEQNK